MVDIIIELYLNMADTNDLAHTHKQKLTSHSRELLKQFKMVEDGSNHDEAY